MSFIYWLIAMTCSPVSGATIVPNPCTVRGAEVCCEWAYIVDRYCCPEKGSTGCEDDCTDEERKEDLNNALWAAERHCVPAVELLDPGCNRRTWQHDGDGFEYYDREPTVWTVLVWWFMPTAEPFDEHLECLRFNPHPETCEGE